MNGEARTTQSRVFALIPGSVRGTRGPSSKIIALNNSAKTVTLSLRLETETQYKSYRASVFDYEGRHIWQMSGIRSNRADTLTITLSSKLFAGGSYVVAIDGEASNREIEAIGRYYFEITRNR